MELQRMVEEEAALMDKINKLSTFANSDDGEFSALPIAEQELLWEQLACMEGYASALQRRIDRSK